MIIQHVFRTQTTSKKKSSRSFYQTTWGTVEQTMHVQGKMKLNEKFFPCWFLIDVLQNRLLFGVFQWIYSCFMAMNSKRCSFNFSECRKNWLGIKLWLCEYFIILVHAAHSSGQISFQFPPMKVPLYFFRSIGSYV